MITRSSNRPNIVINSSNDSVCSVENDMEIMNTSTISLSRSHPYFNKPINESSTSTAVNNNNYPCSQVIENPLNASRELKDTGEELENIETLSLSNNYIDVMHKPTETIQDTAVCTIYFENSLQEENRSPETFLSPTILTNVIAIDITDKDTMMAEGLHHDDVLGNCNSSCNDLISSEIDNNVPSKEVVTEANLNKKRRVTSTFMKSCMDFLTDSEDKDFSSGSSNLWSDKEETSGDSEDHKKNRKRKKTKSKQSKTKTNQIEIVPKKKKIPENKRKSRRQLKEKGLSYVTISGNVKEARKLQENPCKESKCSRKCYEVTDERRKSIFNYFWALNDDKKRDWIVQCSRPISVKRQKTKNAVSRRSVTYEYFINEDEGRRQVCQQFILKTLDISQTYILYTLNHTKEGLSCDDSRTRTAPNKYDETTKLNAKKYIEALPALPSHYSRKKSTKLYLPEHFKNFSNLYRLYTKYCEERSENYLSEKLFTSMFKEYNYAFHVPKKDKCLLCTKNENNPDLTTNEQLQAHLLEKEATYRRFHIHQNQKRDNTFVVSSFDLQKVLATPYGESMQLYYSRKYAVFNFTVYESGTQNGYCYIWGEADGKRGSCEIATCLYNYLKELDNRGVNTLLLYCDNCTGQNKNKVIFSMFKHFLEQSKNLKVIQINYLLAGHTYMPVDSMHAVIEREVRKLIVWAPSQWPSFIESARKRPQPYKVSVLEHTDFINFQNLAESVFTQATLKNKDLRIKNIRVCTFKKNALTKIEVKYTMLETGDTYDIEVSKELPPKNFNARGKGKGIGKRSAVRGKNTKNIDQKNESAAESTSNDISQRNTDNLPSLYNERLPISIPKYNDLKKLCDTGIIPRRFHCEYLNLPNKSPVKDTLNETDDDEDVMTADDDN